MDHGTTGSSDRASRASGVHPTMAGLGEVRESAECGADWSSYSGGSFISVADRAAAYVSWNGNTRRMTMRRDLLPSPCVRNVTLDRGTSHAGLFPGLPNVRLLIPIVGIKHSCRKDRLIVASVPLRIRRQPPAFAT